MTNEERRFKIKKIRENKKEITKTERQIYIESIFAVTWAALAGRFFYMTVIDNDIIHKFLDIMIGVAEITISYYNITSIKNSVARKTTLENEIENINNELDLDNQEDVKILTKTLEGK